MNDERMGSGRRVRLGAGQRRRMRRLSPVQLALSMFALLLVLSCGTLTIIYYTYNSLVPSSLPAFSHQVSRGSSEPALDTNTGYDSLNGRAWNILLLGSDDDRKYTFPAVLTQVMMVAHVDPTNNTISLVSLPRDSWVNIPYVGGMQAQAGGMHKIDQVFFLGATQNNKFDDGVRLARQTVEQDYGIPIDYYAWVGLGGFAKIIDTLGGIDIDVTHPIVDDIYPADTGAGSDPHDPNAYKRLYLAPGPQHLDGTDALDYVRSRHADLVGDIGRTQRQQQVLAALKLKLTATKIVENLPALLKDLSGQVYTDISVGTMLAFANFARSLPARSVQHFTLGPGTGKQDYGTEQSVYDPTTASNQDVIIPNCITIQPVINQIFELTTIQSCHVSG